MEPLFDFLSNYWWLAFPLLGALGGAGKAWERAATRRHERRMELIRAKNGTAALPADAHSAPVADTTASPHDTPAPEPTRGRIARAMDAHDAVTSRWLEYELDVSKMIAYPAMSDGRQELTAAYLRARKVADRLRPSSPDAEVSAADLAAYENAVTDFEVAFDLAEREAHRVTDSAFTPAERKRLDTAKQLLTVAVDEAATPAERQLAYRRVREELDGLISLSDGAIDVLEQKVSLQLPAASPPPASPEHPHPGSRPPRPQPES